MNTDYVSPYSESKHGTSDYYNDKIQRLTERSIDKATPDDVQKRAAERIEQLTRSINSQEDQLAAAKAELARWLKIKASEQK